MKIWRTIAFALPQAAWANTTPPWFHHLSHTLSGWVFSKITIANVSFPWIVALLMTAGLAASLYFEGINIRGLKQALYWLCEKKKKPEPGEVSHFQALATAISGTVGIGNIGGVAVALSIGGPGATFWIIIGGFLGMATKFMECSLGVMFREVHADGSVSGGPMVYLKRGMHKTRLQPIGTSLGMLYATFLVFASVGAGNMFQANQAVSQLITATGGAHSWLNGHALWVGLIMASSVGLVIMGGIRSIVRLTEKIVPFMALLYLLSAFGVLWLHAAAVPKAIVMIWTLAWSPQAVHGGVMGVLMIGMQRAFFSNEAGIGTAAIAHAAVQTQEPLSQGFVALLEPLIDTIIVCTCTALVITTVAIDHPQLLAHVGTLQGVALTSKAFSMRLEGFAIFLALAVVLFAYSTMISWSYYGLKAWTHLVGRTPTKERIFQTFYCACIVLGSIAALDDVIQFSDACIFLLAVPNLIGCGILAPQIKKRLKAYTWS